MANLVPKIPADRWLAAARQALVDDGIDAVRVDRLARRLGVSRGGFYHHFADRDDLLGRLLEAWRRDVVFVPPLRDPANPREALRAIEAVVEHLLSEAGYDPRFDLAVRSWAHGDEGAARAVHLVDGQRIARLAVLFGGLGRDAGEAAVRARVFYFHQIGYYLIAPRESGAARRERVAAYLEILCGAHHLAAARAWTPASDAHPDLAGRVA